VAQLTRWYIGVGGHAVGGAGGCDVMLTYRLDGYFDSLGSTVMMTQGLSTITDRYDYDAWGNEYPIMVSTLDNPYRYVGQLGYYTHWMDSSLSDLLHLGVRFYEPGVGRFSQRDPIPQDAVAEYGYANNQPSWALDPRGESALVVGGIVVAARVIVCAQRCIDNAFAKAQEIHARNDKLAHCYMACRAARCLGGGIAQSYFAPWYMSRDEGDPNDVTANKRGGACARDQSLWPFNKYPDCYTCCKNSIKDLPNDSALRR